MINEHYLPPPAVNGCNYLNNNSASTTTTNGPKKQQHGRTSFVYSMSFNGGSRTRSEPSLPITIGVAGGTASGKTSVCRRIMRELAQDSLGVHERRVAIVTADSFYKALNEHETQLAHAGKYNFDHPDALDASLIVEVVKRLKRGEKVDIPVYDFVQNRPDPNKKETLYPANVIIVEGILIFYFPELRDLFDMKLFVDLDADIRLARRIVRDAEERGRELRGILRQYTTFVKPAFEDFCLPTKTYADVIIPRGADNDVAIELICQHIKMYLIVNDEEKKNNGISSSATTSEEQQQNGELH